MYVCHGVPSPCFSDNSCKNLFSPLCFLVRDNILLKVYRKISILARNKTIFFVFLGPSEGRPSRRNGAQRYLPCIRPGKEGLHEYVFTGRREGGCRVFRGESVLAWLYAVVPWGELPNCLCGEEEWCRRSEVHALCFTMGPAPSWAPPRLRGILPPYPLVRFRPSKSKKDRKNTRSFYLVPAVGIEPT